ncbi:uncharacterized protein LOC143918798 [Arctopsyche grandis]|uniref:uncharacterized protein LOC143918798 n=1 Tax=Arctopsyche grandis TaxID=121162 RepID=UPI00406D6D31
MELRHAPFDKMQEVARVLEEAQAWKLLMAYIPVDLDVKPDNDTNFIPKYTSEHISLIETEGSKQNRYCAEILFDEWGTSGKNRPTLIHLFKLLKQAQLYRAADIISINLLDGTAAPRPLTGPPSVIPTDLHKILAERSIDNKKIESMLDNMSYPNSIPNNQTFNENLNHNINENKYTESDMIKFSVAHQNSASTISHSAHIPALSMLLNNNQIASESLTQNDTMHSNIIESKASEDGSKETQTCDIPNISILLGAASQDTFDLPNLNALQNSAKSQIFTESEYSMEDNNVSINMPILSALQNSAETRHFTTTSEFSFNTKLPHYKYETLEQVTNYFDKEIRSESKPMLPCEIGSGGFGIVYLANGLHEYPVAVKKLKSIQLSKDGLDDLVIRQFKTEVEILSKYKHENILLLLGYSCDTPNHCLVYEFIEGGNLKDNLAQSADFKSQTRMSVALGIAKGIEYLHYGHSDSLIHRDIKSANILLTKTYIPKLCDFGLIRILTDSNSTTNIVGTTAYMAPEAVRGDISVKIDVYSYGIVLLEILTGLPPDDKNRDGNDILTYVQEKCPNMGISTLLDARAGEWNSAEKLYDIANECLEYKRKRPFINEVVLKIQKIL